MTAAADRAALLAAAAAYAQETLEGDSGGHDWWHVARVRTLARAIAQAEGADPYMCELAALLHDIADAKIAGDEETGLRQVRAWLVAQGADDETTARVMAIIGEISFAGGARPAPATLEGQVVQDADRLDAIGAIGIARAFAYGGTHGRPLFMPGETPGQYASAAQYHANQKSTITHFHEKLLLLKDRMNTATGRRLAAERHQYMLGFLQRFAREWAGELGSEHAADHAAEHAEVVLDRLLAQVTDENRHPEMDFGPPVGNEEW